MRKIVKKTAVAALAGVMAAGMLTGCGEEEKVDGTQTVATVNGEDIPMGILSLMVRQSQAQAEAMYASFMGGTSYEIWDAEAEEGKTYGEQAVEETLEQIELMYILREKAPDYKVTVTEEDETAIADAAAAFIKANSEETLEDLAVTEDQVKTYLELQTYQERMHDPIIADVDTNVSDEEAQQSSFTYVSLSTADLSDDEIKQKKEDAQKILDAMKEDPDGDFNETAKSVSEDYTALEGTFDTNESEETETDGEEMTSSSAYPDEVIDVLRTLDDGELGPDVIETDTAYYVVRLNKKVDEEATEDKKESIITDRENELYTDTTQQWMDEADITVDEDVLKTLKLTDSHKFSIATATPTPSPEESSDGDAAAEDTEAADDAAADSTEAADENTNAAAGEDTETAADADNTSTDSTASEDTDAASGDTVDEDEVLVPVEEDVPATEETEDTGAEDAEASTDDAADTEESGETAE